MNSFKLSLLLSLVATPAHAMLAPLARTAKYTSPAYAPLARHMATQSSNEKSSEVEDCSSEHKCANKNELNLLKEQILSMFKKHKHENLLAKLEHQKKTFLDAQLVHYRTYA